VLNEARALACRARGECILRTGGAFALIGWFVACLLVVLLAAPFLAEETDHVAFGETVGKLLLPVVGLPAFLVGYFIERRRKKRGDEERRPRGSAEAAAGPPRDGRRR